MQILLRTLNGGVHPIDIAAPSLDSLETAVQTRYGVPGELQRLRCGVRDLRNDSDVACLKEGMVVCLLLRLVGGKGGFGSLLRVQGRDTKATTNFDACRDLNGKRLRHINAVKKMEEWKKSAQERELQKIALKHIRDLARESKREKRKAIDADIVAAEVKSTVGNVKDAVKAALTKSTAAPLDVRKAKKPRFIENSDSESDDNHSIDNS